ncbi:hypothetical protein lerEdw1_002866 [Lerista edwardsae]|nr:hypothetical protein lerEdw1_002866 [Lerista edwardsae]
MNAIRKKKFWASCFCIMAVFFLLVTLQVIVELGKSEKIMTKTSVSQSSESREEEQKYAYLFVKKPELLSNTKRILSKDGYPVLLWWSPLTGETGRLGQCGQDACFFTINRTYQHHPMTKAFLFYGKELLCFIFQKMESVYPFLS